MLDRVFVTRAEHQRLVETVQRLQSAQAATPSVFDRDDVIDRIAARVAEKLSRTRTEAATAPVGRANESFVAAMLPRGSAGGRARARSAWRYSDGTFMSESERVAAIEEFDAAEYERYAAGGRTRARSAHRSADGTFASNKD